MEPNENKKMTLDLMTSQSDLTCFAAKGIRILRAISQRKDVSKNGEIWPTAILPAITLPAQKKVARKTNR